MHAPPDRRRIDVVLRVVGLLDHPPALGLADRGLHRVGDGVRVHQDLAVDVARGASDRLDQRRVGAQEPFLVRIEDRHQGHLGQVEPFAEQVDPHEDVELPQPEVADDLDPLDRVDLRVEVAHADPHLDQVVREVLRHLLGERRHQHPLLRLRSAADLLDQVVDLTLGGSDLDLRVDQPRGPDDLLHDPIGHLQLPGARRRGHVHDLLDPLLELLETERTVVDRARQPEPEVDERGLPRDVALVHAVELRHRHVRLVDHDEVVVREVVEERVRGAPGRATVDVARVVLDPRAEADLPEHLEVVRGAHPEPLRLEQLALRLELGEALVQLLLDRDERALHPLVARDVMRGRERGEVRDRVGEQLPRERVEPADPLDRLAPPLDPVPDLLVAREHLEGVALDAERAPGAAHVVPLVLDVDEPLHRELHGEVRAADRAQELSFVLLRRPEAVDARDAGHDQDVAPGEQRGGRRVPEPLDLVVHRRVLLDVGVGLRDVGLGLVVVVVAHEVLDRVLGEDLAELVRQLRRQRLVGRDHERGSLDPLDQVGDGERLPGAGGPQERHVLLTRLHALRRAARSPPAGRRTDGTRT